MPYRNPEDKRRWEQDHRQQRNERRREQRLGSQIAITIPKPQPDPTTHADPNSATIVMAIVIILFSVGLLLVVLKLWDVRKEKFASQPAPDPQTPEGQLP
jgi:hypothetical protein